MNEHSISSRVPGPPEFDNDAQLVESTKGTPQGSRGDLSNVHRHESCAESAEEADNQLPKISISTDSAILQNPIRQPPAMANRLTISIELPGRLNKA